jgi:hypothetical protein
MPLVMVGGKLFVRAERAPMTAQRTSVVSSHLNRFTGSSEHFSHAYLHVESLPNLTQ